MQDNKTIADLLGHLHEIAIAQRRIAIAHRRTKIYNYLLWRWQQKHALGEPKDMEAIATQAIDAFDECLKAELEESDPKIEVSLINLIQILNK